MLDLCATAASGVPTACAVTAASPWAGHVPYDVVTIVDDTGCMQHRAPRVGVCIVRVERRSGGLLITLTLSSDIEQVSAEQSMNVAEIEAAVDAVRRFLVRYKTTDTQ
jgi:hypothetical protein